MPKHIGITGTRDGLTAEQKLKLFQLLTKGLNSNYKYLHHGDCIGADVQAAGLAYSLGYVIIGHPPDKDTLRAFFKSNTEEKEPKNYFARNRDIADSCDALLVLPKELDRQNKGGTWYTFDYANRIGKKIILIKPSGETKRYNFEGLE